MPDNVNNFSREPESIEAVASVSLEQLELGERLQLSGTCDIQIEKVDITASAIHDKFKTTTSRAQAELSMVLRVDEDERKHKILVVDSISSEAQNLPVAVGFFTTIAILVSTNHSRSHLEDIEKIILNPPRTTDVPTRMVFIKVHPQSFLKKTF